MAQDGFDSLTSPARPLRLRLSLPVAVALLALGLSLAYAVTFSHMLWVSLLEQVIAPNLNPPRYAGPVHHHHAIEWLLIIAPAVLGWVGVVGSLVYLMRRLLSS